MGPAMKIIGKAKGKRLVESTLSNQKVVLKSK